MIQALAKLMKWVGENLDGAIKLFDSDVTPRTLMDDKFHKMELLVSASEQLLEHNTVYKITQRKFPDMCTYDMPFASPGSDVLRYLKIQFDNKKNQLSNHSQLKEFGLRYHPNNFGTKVIYEKAS